MGNEEQPKPEIISRRKFILLSTLLIFLTACGGTSSSEISDLEEILSEEEFLRLQADYILRCQYNNSGSIGFGALNNVTTNNPGEGHDWIDPGVSATTIISLTEMYLSTREDRYLMAALNACNFLSKLPDEDGKVRRQYKLNVQDNSIEVSPGEELEGQEISPRDVAQMILAIDKVMFSIRFTLNISKELELRYTQVKESLEDTLEILGDFLVGHTFTENEHNLVDENTTFIKGGFDADGNERTNSWVSDNAYACRALYALDMLGISSNSNNNYKQVAEKLENGIEKMKVEENGQIHWATWINLEGELGYELEDGKQIYNWVNYAPLMLGLVLNDNQKEKVANWIINNLTRKLDDDRVAFIESTRTKGECGLNGPEYCYSPGYSLQASLALMGTSKFEDIKVKVMNWLNDSGLIDPSGGLIDWVNSQTGEIAENWKRFIDTSAYFIFVMLGKSI